MTIDQPFAHAADVYRDAGWTSPIPLGPAGERAQKAPVPSKVTGHDARVPSDKVIASWKRTHGVNNIGLHMADDLGVIGIDVDAYLKKGKLKTGDKTIESMEAELECELPDTWTSTARGTDTLSGIHFYRVPPGLEFATKYADVEIIQAKHRYAVVWPSVHPETDELYRWYAPGSDVPAKLPPMLDELTELPKPWLARLLEDAKRGIGLDKSQDMELTEAYAWLEDSPDHMCRAMRNVCSREIARFDEADSGARYDTMVEGVMALVRLSAEGHHGAVKALERLEVAYARSVEDEPDRDVDGEWARALAGAVAAVQGTEVEVHGSKCPDREESDPDLVTSDGSTPWPSPSEPAAVAERLVEELWGGDGLTYWRGDFYEHTGSFWRVLHLDDLRARCWRRMATAEYIGAGAAAAVLGWNPTKTKISNLIEGLETLCHRSFASEPDTGDEDTALIPFRNGVLELDRATGNRVLRDHTTALFNIYALRFDYDEDAPAPLEWLAFLKSLEVDDDVVDLLQEWFGYVVSGDLSKHKMLYLYGDTRAGKGVITRVLQQLVGSANVTSPSLAQFGETFGLSSTIGKTLVTINDARFRGVKTAELIERLLNFTGADVMSINRKNRDAWEGTPGARVMIVSNDLPSISGEQSTAFAKRIIGPIELHKSFYGREDEDLGRRLTDELPEILMWAFDGYDRLCEQERFTTPATSKRLHREIEESLSPVLMFVSERCVVGSDESVAKDELYASYREWAQESGQYVASKIEFGRQLVGSHREAVRPTKVQPRHGRGARVHGWSGVGLVRVTGHL